MKLSKLFLCLLCLLLFTASGYSSLISYYNFSGNYNDSVGAKHGTNSGTTFILDGVMGQAINVTNGDTISTSARTTLSSGTISFFAQFDSEFNSSLGAIFTQSQSNLVGSNPGDHNIRFNIDGTYRINMEESAGDLSSSRNVWSADTWYMVTITWEPGNRTIYIDGILDAQDSVTDTMFSSSASTTQIVGSTTLSFPAYLDEYRIYDTVLEAAEVESLYLNYIGVTLVNDVQSYYNSSSISINVTTQDNRTTNMSYILDAGNRTLMCLNCSSYVLNFSNLSETLHNITFFSNTSLVDTDFFESFTIDITLPTLDVVNFTEENDYTTNFSSLINYSDTNIDTCTVFTDEGLNTTCTNESYTWATNGNHSFNVTATDLAGNSVSSDGNVVFVNPFFYVYFTNSTGGSVTNFSINGTTYSNYFNGTIYQYGLGNHTFEFQKIGFDTTTFTLNFNLTSQINTSYSVPGAKITVLVYDRTTRNLITGTNITIELAGDFGATRTTTTGIANISSLDITPGSYSIFASGSGYESEGKNFVFSNQEIINVSVYMLQSGLNETGTQNVFVENGFGVGLEDKTVKLHEWYASESEFRVVSEKTSQHPFGKVTFDVEIGTKLYRICAYSEGEAYCHEDLVIESSTDDIYIPILESRLTNSDFNFNYSVTCTNTSITGGTQVDMTFSDSSTQITKFCIEVFSKINTTITQVDESCVNSYEGSLSESYLHTNTTIILSQGFAYVGNQSIPVCSISTQTMGNLEEVVDDYGLEKVLPIFFGLLVVGFGFIKRKLEYSIVGLVLLMFGLAFAFPSAFTITIAIICLLAAILGFIIIEVRKG